MTADVERPPTPGGGSSAWQAGRPSAPAGEDRLPQPATTASGAWGWAALFVLPYLLLGLGYVMGNPPGAAPDEPHHLVKSLGMGRLDIGVPYEVVPPPTASLVAQRNASISRVVTTPPEFSVEGYGCTIRKPDESAACLPQPLPASAGSIEQVTATGAYPPFTYVPMGVAALATEGTPDAFYAGRAVQLGMSLVLLLVGAAHLVRWLGRRALVGAVVALTPMAVFSTSVVSTSGIEVAAALAVASVVVVCSRKPYVLLRPGTQVLVAITGSVLVLSRQLGVVTLGVLGLLLVVGLGRSGLAALLRRPRPALVASAGLLLASGVVLALWERAFDRPNLTGPALSGDAWSSLLGRAQRILGSAIGNLGWLDTPLPGWAVSAWVVLAVVLIGTALLLGSRRDAWSLVAVLLALVAVTAVTYAVVFFPIDASIQGRHLLPLFVVCPLLAGVVVLERFERAGDPRAARRLVTWVALTMGPLQVLMVWINSRRYAVGLDGPLWFLPSAEWRPPLGWAPWLALALVGGLLLTLVTLRLGPRPGPSRDAAPLPSPAGA